MNKVWIELPAGETKEERQELCNKANAMLAKLVDDWREGEGFTVNTGKHSAAYPYAWDGSSGYTVLEDNGKWLNLDALSK